MAQKGEPVDLAIEGLFNVYLYIQYVALFSVFLLFFFFLFLFLRAHVLEGKSEKTKIARL